MLGGMRNRVPVSESNGGLFGLVPIFVPYGIFDFCFRFFHPFCSRHPRISAYTHDGETERKG